MLNIIKIRTRLFSVCKRTIFYAFIAVLLVGIMKGMDGNNAFGQRLQGKNYLLPAGMPTHTLPDNAILSGVPQGYFQPVKINVPSGTVVAVAQDSYFCPVPDQQLFGYLTGKTYRLRFSSIPLHADDVLYPTLEIVNRLYPPAGMEFHFPVQVDITQEDIELALSGNLVTRIVFLENPQNAMPVDSTQESGKLNFDVPSGYNPVAFAETKGAIMAVLRMGSRVPTTAPNLHDTFYFGLPPVISAQNNGNTSNGSEQ